MKQRWLVLILALICFLAPSSMVSAQMQQVGADAKMTPIAGWSDQLDDIAKSLSKPDIDDAGLSQLRDELDTIRREARRWITEQTPSLEAVQRELDDIGPPPGEGEEPEAPGLAAERQDLKARLAAIAGPLKEADLALGRSSRLIAELVEIRRTRFAERIMERGPSPVSPSLWRRAVPEMRLIARSLASSTQAFVTSPLFEKRLGESVLALLAALVVAVMLVWPVHRWLLRRYGRDPSISKPDFLQALRATLVVGATRALLPTAAAALVYIVVLGAELLTETGAAIAQAVFLGIVLFTWTAAFFRASLSPLQPNWRIVPVPTNFARGARWVVIGLALAFAVDLVVSEIIIAYNARLAVTVLRDYLLSVVVAALLLALLLRQRMWRPEEEPAGRPRWRVLRLVLALGLASVLIAAAFGYVQLARFAVTQLVLTGGVILLILILHRLGRELIAHALLAESWVSEQLRATLEMDEEGALRLQFWLGLAFDFVLILFGVVIALFVWGADRKDVADWIYQALFGFQIGGFTFSLISLAVALALFTGLVFATRVMQRTLAKHVLPQTQLDLGIQQSIRTGVGYVGIILAAIIGISALGLDLSNLAIVAGALSVGIGFGLQNVVNNFVSGLILLVERPVKVGDWVVVGDKQGYVKRIKVRATEIQTFDRASVFVPNSQLISEAVTNWTYADKMGRVIIPIGVAYGSNIRKVLQILREIGEAHPEVLKAPAPSAMFRSFGDSALNFELRCFLDDVERTIGVTSDLCVAIDDAFREQGIEIPFPQQDVYVKQLASGAGAGTNPVS